MPDRWYYARNRQRRGPFTFRQFRQMAAAGSLTPADMVWNEGASYWVSASEVPGLFPVAAPPPTVPAAPPHPEPPPATTTTAPLPQASGGWDLVERGLLTVADGPVGGTLPGDRSRPAERRKREGLGASLDSIPSASPTGSGEDGGFHRATEAERKEPDLEQKKTDFLNTDLGSLSCFGWLMLLASLGVIVGGFLLAGVAGGHYGDHGGWRGWFLGRLFDHLRKLSVVAGVLFFFAGRRVLESRGYGIFRRPPEASQSTESDANSRPSGCLGCVGVCMVLFSIFAAIRGCR